MENNNNNLNNDNQNNNDNYISDSATNNILNPSPDSNNQNEPTEEERLYYRNIMINFFNKNKKEFVGIYLKHKAEDGDGVMLFMLGLNKVDVSYVPLDAVPESLKPILENRKIENNHNTNIIYLVMVTPCEATVVDVDIRDLI